MGRVHYLLAANHNRECRVELPVTLCINGSKGQNMQAGLTMHKTKLQSLSLDYNFEKLQVFFNVSSRQRSFVLDIKHDLTLVKDLIFKIRHTEKRYQMSFKHYPISRGPCLAGRYAAEERN